MQKLCMALMASMLTTSFGVQQGVCASKDPSAPPQEAVLNLGDEPEASMRLYWDLKERFLSPDDTSSVLYVDSLLHDAWSSDGANPRFAFRYGLFYDSEVCRYSQLRPAQLISFLNGVGPLLGILCFSYWVRAAIDASDSGSVYRLKQLLCWSRWVKRLYRSAFDGKTPLEYVYSIEPKEDGGEALMQKKRALVVNAFSTRTSSSPAASVYTALAPLQAIGLGGDHAALVSPPVLPKHEPDYELEDEAGEGAQTHGSKDSVVASSVAKKLPPQMILDLVRNKYWPRLMQNEDNQMWLDHEALLQDRAPLTELLGDLGAADKIEDLLVTLKKKCEERPSLTKAGLIAVIRALVFPD